MDKTVASSARPCDVCCQPEELSLPVRRQFEEDVWLRLVRIDGRANRPKIGTRQHRPDPALAGDPQGRTMGRAAADEKPGCDQAKHTPTAIRHDLTITTGGDSATRCATVLSLDIAWCQKTWSRRRAADSSGRRSLRMS